MDMEAHDSELLILNLLFLDDRTKFSTDTINYILLWTNELL